MNRNLPMNIYVQQGNDTVKIMLSISEGAWKFFLDEAKRTRTVPLAIVRKVLESHVEEVQDGSSHSSS